MGALNDFFSDGINKVSTGFLESNLVLNHVATT